MNYPFKKQLKILLQAYNHSILLNNAITHNALSAFLIFPSPLPNLVV